MPAARAAAGQFLGRPAIGDRTRIGRRCGLPLSLPLSLSFSLFPLFPLRGSSLSRWHGRSDTHPVLVGVAGQPSVSVRRRARRRPEPMRELVRLPHKRRATTALSSTLRTPLRPDVPHRTPLQVPMGLSAAGPEPNPMSAPLFFLSPGSPKLAENRVGGQGRRRPIPGQTGHRRPVQGRPSMQPPPLSPSVSLFLSLSSLSLTRLLTKPVARSAIIGRPDPHRMLARHRWGSPVNPQARRGGEHAAGPEPMRKEPVWLPYMRRATVALSSALRMLLRPGVPHRTPLQVPVRLSAVAQARRRANPTLAPLLPSLSLRLLD